MSLTIVKLALPVIGLLLVQWGLVVAISLARRLAPGPAVKLRHLLRFFACSLACLTAFMLFGAVKTAWQLAAQVSRYPSDLCFLIVVTGILLTYSALAFAVGACMGTSIGIRYDYDEGQKIWKVILIKSSWLARVVKRWGGPTADALEQRPHGLCKLVNIMLPFILIAWGGGGTLALLVVGGLLLMCYDLYTRVVSGEAWRATLNFFQATPSYLLWTIEGVGSLALIVYTVVALRRFYLGPRCDKLRNALKTLWRDACPLYEIKEA